MMRQTTLLCLMTDLQCWRPHMMAALNYIMLPVSVEEVDECMLDMYRALMGDLRENRSAAHFRGDDPRPIARLVLEIPLGTSAGCIL